MKYPVYSSHTSYFRLFLIKCYYTYISSLLGKLTWYIFSTLYCNLSESSYLRYVSHQSQIWISVPLLFIRRRQWHPTPVLLPGKSHGWRSLVGCSPWGCGESDTTEQIPFHFSLSCIGEGNGNPLQCSCLENPRDGGAWWAAIYGVAQSRTQLKRLSS